MASSSKHNYPSSSAKPLKTLNSQTSKANSSTQTDFQNPISSNVTTTQSPITMSLENLTMSSSSHLTRQELLKRRSHYLKQLSRCYRDLYWALMEDLKIHYREYYWEYGVSPIKAENVDIECEDREAGNVEGSGENNNNNNGNNRTDFEVTNNQRCAFVGCKLKAMPLTSFCHLHILSDSKQKLYKACNYVIKSAQAGPITCGKPIMRSTVPSLCNVHFLKAQKHVTRALKKAGLNVSSSSRLAPKFHVIVAEYVSQVQAKRRVSLRANIGKTVVKEEKAS
ncbi:INO80 complex subunit D-like [Quillaja saponaria]|uniref:KAT8 regulatory NSL complex subunit 2 n=1 Tax=Quillaja saponaria TaxID=32244 RepID=A0AAD7LTR8_QUISA|nr:INO80 complex subunit D-like [Quillaja saponaria]